MVAIFSQTLVVTGVGWMQWTVMETVTLTLLFGLVVALYSHPAWLHKRDALPKCPRYSSLLGDSARLVFDDDDFFVLTQSTGRGIR